jgi:Cu-Zn family superoxide dismutase
MKNASSISRLVCVSAALALGACGGSQQSTGGAATPEAPSGEGEASAGEAAAGEKTVQVTFQPKSGSAVSLSLENVPPGEHGAHVHETGDCSAPDGASAGGHFNPESHPHALPESIPRHLGDLGNVFIDAGGKGTIDILAPGANLKEGDPSSFLGKAIIVHEKEDDGGQPTGNAGGRIGCAVIE